MSCVFVVLFRASTTIYRHLIHCCCHNERVVEAEAHQLEIETLRKEIRETENLRNEMNSYCSEVDTLRNKANEVETLRNEMNSYRSEADTIRKEANESEILRMEIDAYRSESDNLRKEVNVRTRSLILQPYIFEKCKNNVFFFVNDYMHLKGLKTDVEVCVLVLV